jgi:hypothetical protein
MIELGLGTYFFSYGRSTGATLGMKSAGRVTATMTTLRRHAY